jgi:GxxExxY protein
MELKHKELSEKIITSAYNVHKELGYGFLEKVYKNALLVELGEAGVKCTAEFPMKVKYHNIVVGDYFADIITDEKIIIEIKAVSKLESVHEVQLVNYLKATGIEVGLLINFGQSVEIKRRIFG